MNTEKDKSTSQNQKIIQKTVKNLFALYDTSTRDTPDNVLRSFPNPSSVINAHLLLIDTMLPGRTFPEHPEPFDLKEFLSSRLSEAFTLLAPELNKAIPFRWLSHASQTEGELSPEAIDQESSSTIEKFCIRIPEVRKLVVEDVKAAYDGDPAALNFAEIQLAYPGILAVVSHRLAHELYNLDIPIIPRIMSEWVHSKTGIDINPGARIGHGFFIDHATGVVIGETAIIGNRVKIYQGVTLGAKSAALEAGHEGKNCVQRHPTVEDNVVIYANATILGGQTIIGKNSTVGGNLFITRSVPPNSFVIPKLPGIKIRNAPHIEEISYYI